VDAAWLLLVHQLPQRPSRARVQTWRRLQSIGALPIKNGVYVLPNRPQTREDFEWVQAEIGALGGQVSLFAADSIDGLSHQELVAAFRQARRADYQALRKEAERLLGKQRLAGRAERHRWARSVRRLRARWSEIAAIDFFAEPGGKAAAAVLDRLERALTAAEPRRALAASTEALDPSRFRARVWCTRPRPGVDRMASAWLIRRFVDPRARFRFSDRVPSGAGAVPFDMFGGAFSHQGRACTFEVLVQRFSLSDPALAWIAQIVHRVDFRERVAELPEAAAVERLVEGLRQLYRDDHRLLEQGMTMFEALHRSYGQDRRPRRRALRAAAPPGKRAAPSGSSRDRGARRGPSRRSKNR